MLSDHLRPEMDCRHFKIFSNMNIHTQKGNTFAMDIIAGLTVSFAALSLGAAFGTMSGRGAFAGMIGAAVIPIITSIFGGTRIQASGPTAPMTAVSALVVAQAYESFADKLLSEQFITLIFILNAVFLILLGLFRTGRFIALVPNVIILGFMNGIGMLIWADQIKRLFGLGGKDQRPATQGRARIAAVAGRSSGIGIGADA